MSTRSWIAVWLLTGFSVAWSAVSEPPLPEWEPSARAEALKEGWAAGELLLADELESEASADASSASSSAGALPQSREGEINDPETEPNVFPEKYLAAYFNERPDHLLIDPQELLSAADFRDRIGFLEYHSSDSAIDLVVYLFGSDQEIPGEVRLEEQTERLFSEGKPAAVVYYYLGSPQRTAMYLSPILTDAVTAAEQRRALQSSVMQAYNKTDPCAQLEAFLVQMSIRLYWMERMLIGESEGGDDSLPSVLARQPQPVAKPNPLVASATAWAQDYGAVAGSGAIAVLALGGLGMAYRRRRQFRFPDFNVEPRLGGAHAAGVGAVISFASSTIPPAAQRDQVPDYLQRV